MVASGGWRFGEDHRRYVVAKGTEDPNVCVLRVHPRTAELWDGPSSKIDAAFEFVKACLTGEKPNLGENRKVTVGM